MYSLSILLLTALVLGSAIAQERISNKRCGDHGYREATKDECIAYGKKNSEETKFISLSSYAPGCIRGNSGKVVFNAFTSSTTECGNYASGCVCYDKDAEKPIPYAKVNKGQCAPDKMFTKEECEKVAEQVDNKVLYWRKLNFAINPDWYPYGCYSKYGGMGYNDQDKGKECSSSISCICKGAPTKAPTKAPKKALTPAPTPAPTKAPTPEEVAKSLGFRFVGNGPFTSSSGQIEKQGISHVECLRWCKMLHDTRMDKVDKRDRNACYYQNVTPGGYCYSYRVGGGLQKRAGFWAYQRII